MFSRRATSAAVLLGVLLGLPPALAQRTPLTEKWNLLTTQQDVEMGRSLAQDAEIRMNWSGDSFGRGYLNALGSQLAEHAPGYKYSYEFRIFKDLKIQSFALPGGVIFVSSGLMLAIQNEPQLAGILAHQIGHVIARHGTQQVSHAYATRTGTRQGSVSVGEVVSLLGLKPDPGSLLLKYDSQAEQEADVIALQLLYDARFDPQVLTTGMQRLLTRPANLKQDFFRDHAVPVDRAGAVRRELQRLGPLPSNLRGDSPELRTTQRNLRDEEALAPDRVSSIRSEVPSSHFVVYQGRDLEIRYPDNWIVNETGTTVTLTPEDGIISGSLAYGMLIDTFEPRHRDLSGEDSFAVQGAEQRLTMLSTLTDQLVEDLRRTSPNLRVVRNTRNRIAGEEARELELSNDSPVGGREIDHLTTLLRPNGALYYFLTVAPEAEMSRYSSVFEKMIASIRFYE